MRLERRLEVSSLKLAQHFASLIVNYTLNW